MPGTLIKLTNAGRAALVGPGNVGTVTRTITQIGVATASFVHNDDLLVLPNELKKLATFGGENVAPDTVHVTLRDDTADQYTLYGFGLYLDNGVLFGTYSQDTPILEKSPAAMLLLSADMLFTTIDAALLQFGSAEWTNPPATETRQGVVELATASETQTGTDATRAVTPASLASHTATDTRAGLVELATDAEAQAGTDTSRALTPATLSARSATEARTGIAAIATQAEANAGTDDTKIITPKKLATFVQSSVKDAQIGQLSLEPRTTPRAGFVKLNGALLNRADYPLLWAYAQASGALVSEATWTATSRGCFSTGDGATTFRVPDVRGEFMRCWDDARGVDASRGIGTWQDSQNKTHTHTATAAVAGAHTHTAWTDTQGWHGHSGTTYNNGSHSHQVDYQVPQNMSDNDRGGSSSWFSVDNSVAPWTNVAGDHNHSFDTGGAGSHAHGVGVNGVADHTHTITVNSDGGTETRVRNIAWLATIRAF